MLMICLYSSRITTDSSVSRLCTKGIPTHWLLGQLALPKAGEWAMSDSSILALWSKMAPDWSKMEPKSRRLDQQKYCISPPVYMQYFSALSGSTLAVQGSPFRTRFGAEWPKMNPIWFKIAPNWFKLEPKSRRLDQTNIAYRGPFKSNIFLRFRAPLWRPGGPFLDPVWSRVARLVTNLRPRVI